MRSRCRDGGPVSRAPTRVSAFWDNLRRGEESITTLSAEALTAAGIGEDVLANPAYVRRAPLLDGVDEFDADFFGFSPQAARTTDPQHRLFLQCAWHALEDAGYDPARFDGSIGVYGTSSASGYLVLQPAVAPKPEHHHGPGRQHRPDQPVLPERQGLPGDPGIAPVQPARPQHRRSDGVLVVSGRGPPGLPEPAQRRMRHGTGRWRVDPHPAPTSAIGTSRDRSCHRSGTAGRSTCAPTAPSSAAGSASWCSSRCRPPSTTATASTP